jgi:hypothetical protein
MLDTMPEPTKGLETVGGDSGLITNIATPSMSKVKLQGRVNSQINISFLPTRRHIDHLSTNVARLSLLSFPAWC